MHSAFHRHILQLNAEDEVSHIVQELRHNIYHILKRKGGVLGVSGGVDSAVVLALAVRALGVDRVTAVLMPEKESSQDSVRLGQLVCRQFAVEALVENVTEPLLGFGAYQRRDEVVSKAFPQYNATYKLKISLPENLLESATLNIFQATIVSPEGEETHKRLPPALLRQIVAATNFKQRTRAAMLYYHAELRNYAVIGTAQKNEHELGFFVKYGDGAVDVKPIGHLYKTQVYQLAEYLNIPMEIRQRPPTSDTYSAPSSQEEFFFRLPFDLLDLLWYAQTHDIPATQVAHELGLSEEQVQNVFTDTTQKQRSTEYLRMPPLVTSNLVPNP